MKPCKRGHVGPRDFKRYCLECKRLRVLSYYQENKEKIINRVGIWQKENSERSARNKLAYVLRHPERVKDIRARVHKKWKEKDPDRFKLIKKVNQANRKARMMMADGEHSLDDINDIRIMQKGKCAYCRTRLNGDEHTDHIIPISRGGNNSRKNIQLLCPFCNVSKKDRDPIDHARRLGRLI